MPAGPSSSRCARPSRATAGRRTSCPTERSWPSSAARWLTRTTASELFGRPLSSARGGRRLPGRDRDGRGPRGSERDRPRHGRPHGGAPQGGGGARRDRSRRVDGSARRGRCATGAPSRRRGLRACAWWRWCRTRPPGRCASMRISSGEPGSWPIFVISSRVRSASARRGWSPSWASRGSARPASRASSARALAGEAQVLQGRCLAYGEGMTYWPLREIVRQAAGSESRAAVLALLAGEDEAEVISDRIASVLGDSESAYPVEEIRWAAQRLLARLSRERPLLVVIDDVHWAEPTFVDLIEHVVAADRVGPMLVLCLARPEFLESRPDWAGESIALEALSPEESVGAARAARRRTRAAAIRSSRPRRATRSSSSSLPPSPPSAGAPTAAVCRLRPCARFSRPGSTGSARASARSSSGRPWSGASSGRAPSPTSCRPRGAPRSRDISRRSPARGSPRPMPRRLPSSRHSDSGTSSSRRPPTVRSRRDGGPSSMSASRAGSSAVRPA